jgi:protease I
MSTGETPRAIILTADKFEDLEVLYPFFRLLEDGIHAEIAAPKKEQIVGEHGYSVEPTRTFDEVNPEDYDILVLPGGDPNGAPMTVRKNAKAQAIALEFMQKNKPVASICHGPYTLISAGVVRGRRMTSFWGDGVPQELANAGAEYIDAEVVVDKNLITSRFPGDLPAFMRETMKIIHKMG